MIIDAHAHLVAPDGLYAYRTALLADGGYHAGKPKISDNALAACAAGNVAVMDSVGTDLQLISPRPFHQASSMQPSRLVEPWTRANNDTIARTVALHPDRFAGVGALPLVPDQPVSAGFAELDRLVELGFVGALVNPDLHEGRGATPPLGHRYWYPLYERLVERDLPMHVHSAGCFSERETYSEHFVTEESIAILSMLRSPVFEEFPTLRVMISHGGGSAVPDRPLAGRGSAPRVGRPAGRRTIRDRAAPVLVRHRAALPAGAGAAVQDGRSGPGAVRHREARQRQCPEPGHRAGLR
jgi:4-oxalmesaconate hydratase